jgi:hypothetical protein
MTGLVKRVEVASRVARLRGALLTTYGQATIWSVRDACCPPQLPRVDPCLGLLEVRGDH